MYVYCIHFSWQVACNPLYGGTHKYLLNFLQKFNVEVTYVAAGCDVEDYRKACKKNTRVKTLLFIREACMNNDSVYRILPVAAVRRNSMQPPHLNPRSGGIRKTGSKSG